MEPVKRCAIVRIDNMDPACQTFGVHHQFPVLVAGLLQPNLEAELVALRAGAFGEVECFGQYGATSLVAQSNHGGIVRARPESIGVGEIEELAKKVRRLEACGAVRRECYVL